MEFIRMKVQINRVWLLFILFPSFAYSLNEDKCSPQYTEVFIKTVIAVSDNAKQKATEDKLAEAKEDYQNCLSENIESECLNLQRDVHIKTVIALSDSAKKKATEDKLAEAQEDYQNCLSTLD